MARRSTSWLMLGCFLAATAACTGPASRKAASQPGVTQGEIEDCDTRGCFVGLLDYGGQIVLSRQKPDGSLEEIYQVRRARGSTIRSFTHGVLSVATLGIWNIVGYPIEGFMSSPEYIVFLVEYDPAGKPQKVEIQGG